MRVGYPADVVFLVVLFPVLLMVFALVLERFEVTALTPRRSPQHPVEAGALATVSRLVDAPTDVLPVARVA